MPQIATPVFGYKSHISIDRRFGFIRKGKVASAAHSDGRQLHHVVAANNTAFVVWADSAYRSQKNETWLTSHMITSRIHRRKPKGKPMPERTSRANAAKSAVRARVEHVFAHQKTAIACSSAPSALPGRRPNSRSPIWPLTSTA